jgi:hypothetical protein
VSDTEGEPVRPDRSQPDAPEPEVDHTPILVADTPMWLSHHWPSEYDRCVRMGGKHVCRRCLVLYPMAAAAAALAAGGLTWPSRLDVWFCWLLPLPAVLEFCGEHLGWFRYAFRRQVVLTFALAIACGKLYERYLHHTRDRLTWSIVITYGGICLVAALVRAFNPPLDRR